MKPGLKASSEAVPASKLFEHASPLSKQATTIQDLPGLTFFLVNNKSGHASAQTSMVFADSTEIIQATYSGPNISLGHALINPKADGSLEMVYHALQSDSDDASSRELNVGMAQVALTKVNSDIQMTLHWRWLHQPTNTTDAFGESVWHTRSSQS